MRHNPISYYADFVVYPIILMALLTATWHYGNGAGPLVWLIAAGAGVILWTLLEYLIHRFIFHAVIYVADLHNAHHEVPTALLDTPVWLSLSLTVLLFAVMAWTTSFDVASGFTFGAVAGYSFYGLVHHAGHHWHLPHDTYFYRAKRWHARHHYAATAGNFGVTSLFWDHVFGTVLTAAASDGVKRRDGFMMSARGRFLKPTE